MAKSEILHIKNMVCPRCIKAVGHILSGENLKYIHIELGRVTLSPGIAPSEMQMEKLRKALQSEGFELIDDEKTRTVNAIKTKVIEWVHHDRGPETTENFSDYLSRTLNREYTWLSHLFSSIEARSIEKYVISQRVERVKELLIYGELSISEIAFELGYSSVQYLSNQFKSNTGLSPAQFRKMMKTERKSLDEI